MLIKIMLKQLSNRVSAKTIEETYTDIDVAHVKDKGKDTSDISLHYLPDTGFTFDYPQRWLNEQTDFKAIGIRRLKVVPTSHVFTIKFNIVYRYKNNVEDHEVKNILYHVSVTPANTLEEVLHNMIDTLNSIFARFSLYEYNQETGKDTKGNEVLSNHMAFTYTFDYRTGDLTLNLVQLFAGSFTLLSFNIEGDELSNTGTNNLHFFLKFLNQERSNENARQLLDLSEFKHFTDVWDRSTLQFHASFGNGRRKFIGLNDDFYENPSMFYDPPTNSSDFWIKFTTDGRHQFLPRYCRFYISLSFVRNYKNSLVTK